MIPQEFKAFFFDIDGTLADKRHMLNPVDLESFRFMKEKGLLLFVATGRDLTITDEAEILGPVRPLIDGYISVNGQECFLPDGTMISAHPIADEDFFPLRRCCEDHHFPMLYRRGSVNYLSDISVHAIRYWKFYGLELPPIHAMDPDAHDVPKLCIHVTPRDEEELILPLLSATWTARITEDLIDLIPVGVGKDSGIREMCEHFGISPEQTMAFGDGQNDITMLRAAGLGVAMENAADNVKAVADYVTGRNEDNGITSALKHFGII